MYPGPNLEMLEAQARVCTGPHQSRPLGRSDDGPQPQRILQLVFQSLKGELPAREAVSPVQMGAFFAAMRIRRGYGEKTGWCAAEHEAFSSAQGELEQMPPVLRFLLHAEQDFTGDVKERRSVEALCAVLEGGHLSYRDTRAVLTDLLAGHVRPELMAAFLIGQRMNIENDDEVLAYLDAVLTPEQVVDIDLSSLTHFGQPFDGALRYFRPTLFVAATRAALGRPTVLHGVDHMPPKNGITEEQLLKKLGARIDLSLAEGAVLLRDIGLAYISQREYAPGAYALRALREHIKKRPPWATTEKAQQLYRCSGRNCAVLGFYHIGYEAKLLDMMRARGYDAGLAITGEEGTTHYALRLGKASDTERKAVNYTEGFCGERIWAEDVQPLDFGIDYEQSPRTAEASAEAFVREGMAALAGEQGAAYDRIALSVGASDYYLGFCDSAREGVEQARRVLDDGRARKVLLRYVEDSHKM